MMGAQNARTLVKNQWRTKTTSSVFFVRIHVWLTMAPAMVAGSVEVLVLAQACLGCARCCFVLLYLGAPCIAPLAR